MHLYHETQLPNRPSLFVNYPPLYFSNILDENLSINFTGKSISYTFVK